MLDLPNSQIRRDRLHRMLLLFLDYLQDILEHHKLPGRVTLQVHYFCVQFEIAAF